MKIVIGHKNLNLEELFNVSCLPSQMEVVIDSQVYAELNPQQSQSQSKDCPDLPTKLVLR